MAVVGRGEGDCEGSGWIEIFFAAEDDRASPAQLGFELTAVSGVDDRIWVPAGVQHHWWAANQVTVNFSDWSQAIDLELDIVAVDLNGNRSTPVRVHVVDVPAAAEEEEGQTDGGCSATGGGRGGGAAALAGFVALFGLGSVRREPGGRAARRARTR